MKGNVGLILDLRNNTVKGGERCTNSYKTKSGPGNVNDSRNEPHKRKGSRNVLIQRGESLESEVFRKGPRTKFVVEVV